MAFPGYGAGMPMSGVMMVGGGGAPPPVHDPMWGYFSSVAGMEGQVDAEKLQRCLTQSGFSGSYTPFSLETCRIMIAMLDRNMTGTMEFNEFKELFMSLNSWKQNFRQFDRDMSGTVEPHEMAQAIPSMGFRLSPQTVNTVIRRYSKNGRIFFDDYVACCVKLSSLTDNFKRRDAMQQGMVHFQYDDFIMCTMAI